METATNKRSVAQGVAWASSAQWGGQLLGFAIYTGLARLLTPQIFGEVAIAGIYIVFMQLFVQQGFGAAIIQRRELEQEHINSAFWIALVTALSFCLLTIMLGGTIARLFRDPQIAPVIEWLSLSFLFYALAAVPTALLTRDLNFRPFAVRSLIAIGVGGAVGLSMAYLGWGVWSLVWQQLVNSILSCITLWWAVSWRPGLRISGRHLRDLYGFSLSVTGNDILWFFAQKSDQTLVGYGFGPTGLGPYSLASRLITLLHDSLVGPVQSVALPAFSKLQSNPVRFEQALQKFCEMSAFVSLPVFTGIAIVAPELVPLLFGSRWAGAIPILRILAVYGALRVILSFMHPLMLAIGRPGLYLFLNVILAILTFGGCFVAIRWTPEAVGVSLVLAMLLSAVVSFSVIQEKINIRVVPLLMSFASPLFLSALMLAVVTALRNAVGRSVSSWTMLVITVLSGLVTYVLISLLVRPDLVKTIWEMVGHSVFLPKPAARESSISRQGEIARGHTAESSEL